MELIAADTRGPYKLGHERGLLAGRQDGGVGIEGQDGPDLGRRDGRRSTDARELLGS